MVSALNQDSSRDEDTQSDVVEHVEMPVDASNANNHQNALQILERSAIASNDLHTDEAMIQSEMYPKTS